MAIQAGDYERGITMDAKNNPKGLFKCKESLASDLSKDGSVASNNEDKANVLNNFFSSVFTQKNTSSISEITSVPVN